MLLSKWILAAIVGFLATLASFSSAAMEEDEAGIWMVVEKQEQFLRTSPHRNKDLELESYINSMVCEITPSDCGDIRVYVLNVPGLNAFMMPNGSMFIQTGLLLRMTSSSELAAVVAHEYVHYRNKHSIENIRRWRKTSNTFAVLGAVVGAAGSVAAAGATSYEGYRSALDLSNSALYMLQSAQIYAAFQLIAFSRDDETESDLQGLEMIAKAGYDPTAASTIWENYIVEESFAEDQRGFSALSTHPMPETRKAYLRELADKYQTKSFSKNDEELFSYISDETRLSWISSEARVLHPSQFEGLIHNQAKFTSTPEGFHLFSAGKAWELYASRQGLLRSEQRKAVKKAKETYLQAMVTESGMPKEGYRALAKIAEDEGDLETAKSALTAYLKIAPDAWDAKFVQKKLDRMR